MDLSTRAPHRRAAPQQLQRLAELVVRHRGERHPNAARLDLPKRAPRALDALDAVRWLRAVERWLSPRDRVVALLPY